MKTEYEMHVRYLTETSGRPTAVVLDLQDWRRITETLGILANRHLMRSLRRAERQITRRAPLLTKEEVFRNL